MSTRLSYRHAYIDPGIVHKWLLQYRGRTAELKATKLYVDTIQSKSHPDYPCTTIVSSGPLDERSKRLLDECIEVAEAETRVAEAIHSAAMAEKPHHDEERRGRPKVSMPPKERPTARELPEVIDVEPPSPELNPHAHPKE
jgi:hypothetical protein